MISSTPLSRTGARRVADVPAEILHDLNTGRIEAATLVENLATDFSVLLSTVFPDFSDAAQCIDPKLGITKRMSAVAGFIYDRYGESKFTFLAGHHSDLCRGWAAYLLAYFPDLSLQERLNRVKIFAVDPHFGVREWAWLAMRPYIVEHPQEAIEILQPWVREDSAYLRRFAVESTRPRGVWSTHISVLKTDPAIALPLLKPLRADPARYVQDSVANWLNDAWKSSPDWVEKLCKEWNKESLETATHYITKRALRGQIRKIEA